MPLTLPTGVSLPTRLFSPGQRWSEYHELIPAGIPLPALLNGDYWKRVASSLKPFDTICVVAEDGSFDADIRLIAKSREEMTFRVIREVQLDAPEAIRRESREDRYIIQGSKPRGCRILDTDTGRIVADGLDAPIAEHERARLMRSLSPAG